MRVCTQPDFGVKWKSRLRWRHNTTCIDFMRTSDITALLFGDEDVFREDDGVWVILFRLLASLSHGRVLLFCAEVDRAFLHFVWMSRNISNALKPHINTRYINVFIRAAWWRSSKSTTVLTGHDKPEVAEYGGPHEAVVDVLQRERRHLVVCRKAKAPVIITSTCTL